MVGLREQPAHLGECKKFLFTCGLSRCSVAMVGVSLGPPLLRSLVTAKEVYSSIAKYKSANDLVRNQIRPTSIIRGYRVGCNINFICSEMHYIGVASEFSSCVSVHKLAMKESCKYV